MLISYLVGGLFNHIDNILMLSGLRNRFLEPSQAQQNGENKVQE